jgi:Zn-dependent peptidase ImmA (M78 family)
VRLVADHEVSCAHEVAHLLIPSYSEQPVRKIDIHTGTFANDREEETLCDLGAQELLMPTEHFRRCALRYGVGIASVKQLAEDFQTSLEATCIKISSTGVYGCTALILELGIKPSQEVPEGQGGLPGMESMEPGRRLRVR